MYKTFSFKKKIIATAIASTAMAGFSGSTFAQESVEEVVVTGIRASLERAMDIKRNSSGVVDAINAEDIGKFPDTNLAESMQRITGVSIDRVNGEGSQVTVRGFGAQYNLVTLNGRQMPTSRVGTIGGDQGSDTATGAGRSFEFGNLASEGVSGLEVFKTGQANVASGGIGATVNIKTLRPLDSPGVSGTVGVKAMHDTGVEFSGENLTPEVSGMFSWTNDDETWGVSLFGSFQERHTATRSATANGWEVRRPTLDGLSGMITANTVTNIDDLARDQWVTVPPDSRYHLAEVERERVNGALTVQYRPVENVTLTLDGLFVTNKTTEARTDQTNWFNRPYSQLIFDTDPVVASAVYLAESIAGVKDTGFEQQYRAVDNEMQSVGFNADWGITDTVRLNFDFHTASSETLPGGPATAGAPGGANSVLVSMGAPVVAAHSLDFRTGFPVQSIAINDSLRGNGNGWLDPGDLGSQMARTVTSSQTHDLDAAKVQVSWDIEDNMRLNAGVHHTMSDMLQRRIETQQTLGDWGIDNVGDVPASLITTYCMTCLFDDYNPRATGPSQVAFRANAIELNNYLSPIYAQQGRGISIGANDNNRVEEDITAIYAQFQIESELAGLNTRTQVGVRYEETEVTSTSMISVPGVIRWESDNDFRRLMSDEVQPVTVTGEYDNLLPSLDFAVDLTEDLVARASWSKTIGRAGYGSLFANNTVGTPPRPIATGGRANGNAGNPSLLPLESRNIDLSLEWYFGDASYISGGFYEKRVKNFEGTSVVDQPMFGLRDPSSAAPGTRSGRAAQILNELNVDVSDVHLFTMTALLINRGSEQAARDEFMANYSNGALGQTYVDQIIADYDVLPDSTDPLFQFAVQMPVNNREAKIYGFEFAFQHFFGDTGFGVQTNYTTVTGDVGINRGAAPGENQFALTGLSDTANFILMYENFGWSARLGYNWREGFLSQTNRGDARNPVFVDDYAQLDLNISYDVSDNLAVTFEAINITGENIRNYARNTNSLWFIQELDPRYLVGARYRF